MKRAIVLIVGIVISVVFFAWSLEGVDTKSLIRGFANANYLSLPVLLGLLFGFYWLKTIRWAWLLSPAGNFTFRDLFGPMLIGFAANNILPAHLGEFVRVFVVRRQYGVPAATVLSTVVLERIFDVMAILMLFGVGLAFSGELPSEYRKGALILGGCALAVVIAVVIYLIWTEWFLRTTAWILSYLPFIPESLGNKILDMLRTGASGLGALRSGRMVVAITISSLLQWLLNGLIAYVALRAFGIPVSVATGLIVTGVTAVAVTIPSTPGYFGIIQGAFKLSMESQTIQQDPALVLGSSVYYHLSMYIPVTVLGIYYLMKSGLHLKDLQDPNAIAPEAQEGSQKSPTSPHTPESKMSVME